MGMRSRFRQIVGICGSVAVMATMATGAAVVLGQTAASASVTGSVNVDVGPQTTGQNYSDTPGAGYNLELSNWHAGDTITLTVAPSNGQLTSSFGYDSAGNPVAGTADTGTGNCHTQMSPVFPASTSVPGAYFGVNQNPTNGGNFVGFDPTNAGLTGLFGYSGSVAPLATVAVKNLIGCSENTTYAANAGAPGAYENLVITLTNSNPGGSAILFIGFSASYDGAIITAPTDPLRFDVSKGANTGATQASGAYTPLGCESAACVQQLTVASDITVIGQTPTDAHALNVQRNTDPAVVGGLTVPPQPISNFVINEAGDFLPPPDTANSVFPPNFAGFLVGTNTTPTMTPDHAPGAVCLAIDNGTHNNLIFATTPTWSVTPGANTAGFSAAAGPASVVNDGQVLQLPVTAASNGPAVWTASGLVVTTAPGFHTHADGPVWAAAYWVEGPVTSTSCADADLYSGGPGLFTTLNTANPLQLGYVQLTTVTELANSIYGATTEATAAQALEHQFDYAKGECVGNQFPEFLNGGAVFLGRSDDYHDVLGAAYPAGADDTGVLLTPVNSLDQNALNAIRLEGVQTVYLLGGVNAQSQANFLQLSQTPSYLCGGVTPRFNILGQPEDLTVIRIGGATSNDTNQMLAEFVGAQPIFPVPGAVGAFANPSLFNDTGSGISAPPSPALIGATQNSAILTTDASFQDAVSGSTVAYGWPLPLIITDPGSLSPQALNALYNDHITQIFLLGGTGAVSDTVVTQLGALGFAVLRIAGIDASDTSTQFASFTLAAGVAPLGGALHLIGLAAPNIDFNWDRFTARTAGEITFVDHNITAHVVLLARGDFFGDATTASVLAIHNGLFGGENLNPLVLSESPSVLGTYVTGFLNEAGLAVSGLAGSTAGFGPNSWQGQNTPTSSVYVIQPVGGPVALTPALLNTAISSVG
jgi:hypothetical protein